MCTGSAFNHAGRSSGLTSPNGPAQSALVRSALAAAWVGPHEVALVSLHGTGTPLGDPIEVGALGQALAGGQGLAAERLILGRCFSEAQYGAVYRLLSYLNEIHPAPELLYYCSLAPRRYYFLI